MNLLRIATGGHTHSEQAHAHDWKLRISQGRRQLTRNKLRVTPNYSVWLPSRHWRLLILVKLVSAWFASRWERKTLQWHMTFLRKYEGQALRHSAFKRDVSFHQPCNLRLRGGEGSPVFTEGVVIHALRFHVGMEVLLLFDCRGTVQGRHVRHIQPTLNANGFNIVAEGNNTGSILLVFQPHWFAVRRCLETGERPKFNICTWSKAINDLKFYITYEEEYVYPQLKSFWKDQSMTLWTLYEIHNLKACAQSAARQVFV